MYWRHAWSRADLRRNGRRFVAGNLPDAFPSSGKGHEPPLLLKPVRKLFCLAEWSCAMLGAARSPNYRRRNDSPIAHFGRKT